jgi:septal ring factor EnvC (AmiA/AmiB activator)
LFPTFAISIDPEEARKAEERKETKAAERKATKAAERAAREANGAELPVILVTTPISRGTRQLEMPVRGRPGGLLGPGYDKNRRARTQQ